MPFPSPPWLLNAELWLSVFVVRSSDRSDRPPGVYGAAFVDYTEGGVLAYHELLVARLVDGVRSRRVSITDIWVDSPTSRDGARSLWAIPKELAHLPLRDGRLGPTSRTTFSAVAEGQQVASAAFLSVPGAALVRTPFAMSTVQQSPTGEVVTPFTGSGRGLPCRGAWKFDPHGPLAFLQGRHPALSVRASDVRLRFGL